MTIASNISMDAVLALPAPVHLSNQPLDERAYEPMTAMSFEIQLTEARANDLTLRGGSRDSRDYERPAENCGDDCLLCFCCCFLAGDCSNC
jgi:hypothetical protein